MTSLSYYTRVPTENILRTIIHYERHSVSLKVDLLCMCRKSMKLLLLFVLVNFVGFFSAALLVKWLTNCVTRFLVCCLCWQ